MSETEYPTDPTTLRHEARQIQIGLPDGNGYAGPLRACADRIEELELALSVSMSALAPGLPGDSRAVPDWFVACAAVQSRITSRNEEAINVLRNMEFSDDKSVDPEVSVNFQV